MHASLTKASSRSKQLREMMVSADEIEQPGIVYPDSPLHLTLGCARIAAFCYLALAVPARIEGQYGRGEFDGGGSGGGPPVLWSPWIVVDYAVDAFFLADMWLHYTAIAFTEMQGGQEVVVTDRQRIASRYLRSPRFRWDLLASLPVDVLGFAISRWSVLRLPHLVRAVLLPTYVDRISRFVETHRSRVVSPATIIMVNVALAAVILVHWTSVGWDMFHYRGQDYLRSLYWTVATYTTVGYGDVHPADTSETWYAIVFGTLGATFCAGLIANITSYVHTIDVSEDNMQHQREVLLTWAEQHRLSEELHSQVLAYQDFVIYERSGIDEVKMVKTLLPDHMQQDLAVYFTHNLVLSSKLLMGLEPFFLRNLMHLLEQTFYTLGDTLHSDAAPANGMHFIVTGTVRISVRKRTVLLLTHAGTFGEENLLSGSMKLGNREAEAKADSGDDSGDDNDNSDDDNGSEGEDAFDALGDGGGPAAEAEKPASYEATAETHCDVWFLERTRFLDLLEDFDTTRLKLAAAATRFKPVYQQASTAMTETKKKRQNRTMFGRISALPRISVLHGLRRYRKQRGGAAYATKAGSESARHIEPDSMFARCWRVALLFFTLYNTFMVPLRAAFSEGDIGTSVAFDWLGDALFLVDIVLQMYFVAFVQNGEQVTKRALIAHHYRTTGRFYWHAVAALPLDPLVLALPRSRFFSPLQMLSLLRVHKLFRLADVSSTATEVEKFALGFKLSKNAFRIVNMMFLLVLTSHVVGCMFFLLANVKHLQGSTHNWADKAGVLRACSLWPRTCAAPPSAHLVKTQYLMALYWATATVTTVGYGDISSYSLGEVVFATCVLVIGTYLYTLVVAYMTEVIAQLDATQSMHHAQLDHVKRFCAQRNLPAGLQKRIEDYYEFLWQQNRGIKGKSLLRYMRPATRHKVVVDILGHQLSGCFYLRTCAPRLLRSFVCAFELELYLPASELYV